MTKIIGVLTSGGDTPGLNAAIRAVGKSAIGDYGMSVIGFRDGFRGLMENRTVRLDSNALSGILTLGGTILGTSRDKPHKMPMGGKTMDMRDAIVEVYHQNNLDALVCLGGRGTMRNAYLLHQKGLNVMTLPKTIDNDIPGTDISFGFDTALTIASEAIDRLHSTAHSHHRIIVVEIMGHGAGWLALGSGIAGGADVILIPEIPYDVNKVAESILQRTYSGKHFSIVAISEGAMSLETAARRQKAKAELAKAKEAKAEAKETDDKEALKKAKAAITRAKMLIAQAEEEISASTQTLTTSLEAMTNLESRVTILGHVQRGGTPSPADRLLATRLGTAATHLIQEGVFGVLVATKGDQIVPIPFEELVDQRNPVSLDHPWIKTARSLGTSLGD
ncbi:6-phosphofructokinase [Phototrophicus methaneseepsis]|uniref:ATP-dependent 6-phosphofructokinase n=1 Tax=Phototrophicus methaneseepsis TaxID=2710758 RepID=A0A7S8IFH4_9CHLR|nr:ATP-dependent 6-phosphofructokinase [Phototrophicus methaneseepsis]QPC83596.1 6-phosphofructokinase [Phototrophicus methaneseepsis]